MTKCIGGLPIGSYRPQFFPLRQAVVPLLLEHFVESAVKVLRYRRQLAGHVDSLGLLPAFRRQFSG